MYIYLHTNASRLSRNSLIEPLFCICFCFGFLTRQFVCQKLYLVYGIQMVRIWGRTEVHPSFIPPLSTSPLHHSDTHPTLTPIPLHLPLLPPDFLTCEMFSPSFLHCALAQNSPLVSKPATALCATRLSLRTSFPPPVRFLTGGYL